MSIFYLPQNPGSTDALSLPDSGTPYLLAEGVLDQVVSDISLHLKFMPEMTPEVSIPLVISQKIEKTAAAFDAIDHKIKRLVGQSPSGHDFFAIQMSDSSIVIGEMNTQSGMVSLLPFPLMASPDINLDAVAREFDTWRALRDAAPPLHLNHDGPPDLDTRKVPTWLSATLLDLEDRLYLRDFFKVSIKALAAHHPKIQSLAGASMIFSSRTFDRDGLLSEPTITLETDSPAEKLQVEIDAFLCSVRELLSDANFPVPAERQVDLGPREAKGTASMKYLLAVASVDFQSMSAHDYLEASYTWTQLLAQK